MLCTCSVYLVCLGPHLWLGQSQAWPGGHTPMLSDHLLLFSSHSAQLPPGSRRDKSWSQTLLIMISSGNMENELQWRDKSHYSWDLHHCNHEIIVTAVTFNQWSWWMLSCSWTVIMRISSGPGTGRFQRFRKTRAREVNHCQERRRGSIHHS